MIVDLGRIESALQPLLLQEAVELVDLRFLRESGRWILRFYIDKTGGVSIDDCEYMSNRIGALLDSREDLLPGAYTLEVSSPGLDRILKKRGDFERFMGHRVKIRLKIPLSGQRHFRGYLKGLEGLALRLESGETVLSLPLEDIDEARLDPDITI